MSKGGRERGKEGGGEMKGEVGENADAPTSTGGKQLLCF
jgi:hypothetical protein